MSFSEFVDSHRGVLRMSASSSSAVVEEKTQDVSASLVTHIVWRAGATINSWSGPCPSVVVDMDVVVASLEEAVRVLNATRDIQRVERLFVTSGKNVEVYVCVRRRRS